MTICSVRFEVITIINMLTVVFWNVTGCIFMLLTINVSKGRIDSIFGV
jgi:hypothetical protein